MVVNELNDWFYKYKKCDKITDDHLHDLAMIVLKTTKSEDTKETLSECLTALQRIQFIAAVKNRAGKLSMHATFVRTRASTGWRGPELYSVGDFVQAALWIADRINS
jgi:hypothetical protein